MTMTRYFFTACTALLGIVVVAAPHAQADDSTSESGEGRLPLACNASSRAYDIVRAGKARIHQNGSTGYGGGEHPDIRVTLCIEGPHHECWFLPKGGAMQDVVGKEVGPGDSLVVWHDEGGGGGRVMPAGCSARTDYASFEQGGTSASFNVEVK